MLPPSTIHFRSDSSKEVFRSGSPACIREASALLRFLLESGIIHPEEWDLLSAEVRCALSRIGDSNELVLALLDKKILNPYQADRVAAGTMRGLVLGRYRILGSLGAGGLGIVFEGEHVLMRRKVALKVLPIFGRDQPDLIARFVRETRAVAGLEHPNIVAAFDAGMEPATHDGEPDLYYFVMEHLTGSDLEKHVDGKPMPIEDAVAIIYQTASALDEAHRHQLVHRDIKPANIFVTTEGQAKLLDFGLVRPSQGDVLTQSDDLVGTLEYMAPEQIRNPVAVDIRSDIYSLGATLFFALTGKSPFPLDGSVRHMIECRLESHAPRASTLRAEIPESLDSIIERMMAFHPTDRYPTPRAVMHALLPFVENTSSTYTVSASKPIPRHGTRILEATDLGTRGQILIYHSDSSERLKILNPLRVTGFHCVEVSNTEEVLERVRRHPPTAILLGIPSAENLPTSLVRYLRANPPCPNLKILVFSPRDDADEMAAVLAQGADDYLGRPISDIQLVARVRAAVRHKEVQDGNDRLNQQLQELNVELERSLQGRTSDFVEARSSLVLALARLVEYRSTETIAHLSRMQRYCSILASEAAALPAFASQIDHRFVQTLECCAPLHDIGNVGLPDAILLKSGPLDPQENEILKSHTIVGAKTLQQVAHRFGASAGFLNMAIDVTRHHHENFDGTGYPDGLKGEAIPLSARIVAIADAYDALRTRRMHRPGLPHAVAVQVLLETSKERFDPSLLAALDRCAPQFQSTFREIPDSFHVE